MCYPRLRMALDGLTIGVSAFVLFVILYAAAYSSALSYDASEVAWREAYLRRPRNQRLARRPRSSEYRIVVRARTMPQPSVGSAHSAQPLPPQMAVVPAVLLADLHMVVIGIDFTGTQLALGGPSNDERRIKAFFETYGHVDVNDADRCVFLNDTTSVKPTDKVIRHAMDRLVCTPTESDHAVCLWHYSGHGLLVNLPPHVLATRPPHNTTDESIVPINIHSGGQLITDGEMYERIVVPLTRRPGVRFFGLFDSCYSGMNLRLKHIYEVAPDGVHIEHRLNTDFPREQAAMEAVMAQVNVVMMSACRATEEAAEVYSDAPEYQPHPQGEQMQYGAFTDAVYDRFEADTHVDHHQKYICLPTTTWAELLVSVQSQFVREGIQTQHVQITSSKPLHLNEPVFGIFDPLRPFP